MVCEKVYLYFKTSKRHIQYTTVSVASHNRFLDNMYYCDIWSSQSISVDVLLLGLYRAVY